MYGMRAHRRLERPAQHDAPDAAGEVLHHQQREAAEDHAHPERVGDQVRLEKTIGARHEVAGHGQHDAEHAGDHAELPHARQRRAGRQVGFRSRSRR